MRATGPSFGLATCTRVRLHRHVPDMACVRAEYCGMPELYSACGAGGDLVPDGGDLTEPGDGRVVEQVIQRLLDQVTRGVRGGGGRQLGSGAFGVSLLRHQALPPLPDRHPGVVPGACHLFSPCSQA